MSSSPRLPQSRIEAEVLRVRSMLQTKRFAEGLSAARSLQREVPENRDVLYMLAVALRYLNRIPEALETLAQFETLHPNYSRLFQERGHCHVLRRDAPAAIEAFLRAVHLNAALPASWQALQVLFGAVGQAADARLAGDHVAKLASLPVPVVTASSMFADGETFEAERVIREFLLANPDHVEAMRLLAQIGMKLEILDDAEFLLERVLTFAPDYHLARHDYVNVLLHRHRHAQALVEAKTLIEADPENRNYRTVYAAACIALGRHEEGLQVYRRLSAEAPRAAELHLSIAHVHKTAGAQQAAIEAYRAAAVARPTYGDAYWSLANLKTYRFSDAEIDAMRQAESAADTAIMDRYHLCFALGKALEDRAQFGESFRYYERGNALKRSETRYRPEFIERDAKLQEAICTREFLAARAGSGCVRPDPIFIVGLPRAGSTLLEQILASHSAVDGTMELAEIPRLVHSLQGRNASEAEPRYPAVLADLTMEEFRRFGERYLADTQIYRSGKPFFVDKMPNNFRHLGLIQLILPNARIIDARREPMACCFSNFKQLFAAGQEFTYGIEEIARYYVSYTRLMAHWDAVLPGKVLRIQHEHLVADLETHVHRILDFCGLPFEPACLKFYQTARHVRTASSEQVRQPIYTDSLCQWRHFEPWLGPLEQALRRQF